MAVIADPRGMPKGPCRRPTLPPLLLQPLPGPGADVEGVDGEGRRLGTSGRHCVGVAGRKHGPEGARWCGFLTPEFSRHELGHETRLTAQGMCKAGAAQLPPWPWRGTRKIGGKWVLNGLEARENVQREKERKESSANERGG